ncbi:uncharacterized protein OCT59_003749 [Rhizophagus irregularis]|nr:hypothetical protein OCT59_003749 [Rhizophagus irregularis]
MDLGCIKHETSKTKVPQCIQECCRNCLRILYFKQIEGYFPVDIDYSNIYIKHNTPSCNMCSLELTFTSDCQKYCTSCLIFYTGCRYCLTTNIIFGLTGQTHCKKCKRISLIIDNVVDRDLADFLFNDNIYEDLSLDFAKTIDEYFEPLTLLNYIFKTKEKGRVKPVRWIPYSQFKDIKEMTKGGYGIIYKATWLRLNNKTVILKRFENSKNNNKYFLNELRSNQQCFTYQYIINTYGFTKDPELEDYILVMEYASEGNLHKYLQKNFTNIKWNSYNIMLVHSKLNILRNISEGCWDPDPKKRPPIKEIHVTLCSWFFKKEFVQAEEKRNKLIKSKKIGPEFAEKYHSKAIYTSRPLSALISKCLSTNSSSTISFGNNQDYNYNYISKEKDLDIDIESLSSQNLTIQNSSPSLRKRNNEELNLDTYDNSVGKRIKTS